MKVVITYDNASTRQVELDDAVILNLAQQKADYLDMVDRETAKPIPVSVAAVAVVGP